MAHPAETALLILNLISMLPKFSIINLQHFYPLKPSFFFFKESSLSSLFKYCLFLSSIHFISWISLESLFPPLHGNKKKKKKTYSKLLFLKKKAPNLPSCSSFCLSLIHFPHKQILLKHRLDHVTHPLKSLLPKTFQFLKKNSKFLTLIWNDKQGSPFPLSSRPKCISLYLNSSSTPISFLIQSLCKLVPLTQNLWHIPARIISTQLSSPQLKYNLFREGFLVPQV